MTMRKPFDPAVRRLLNEQAAGGPPPTPQANEARVQMARAFFAQSLENRTEIAGLPNTVQTRALEIAPGLAGRLYLPPNAQAPLPVLVYAHGGGWTVGSVAIFDPFCRLLCGAAGVSIVSVEYRLAPEHPYPAALEDIRAAVQWTAAYAANWGADPMRLALGGDSAGANLAAVTANQLCAEGGALRDALKALLLLYPVTAHPSAAFPSYTENAVGYGLDAGLMRWFWEQYAAGVAPDDPNVAPLSLENVPALPPTFIATAEYDVLRDEGIAYAEKLTAAGVAVTHLHAPDMGHNFPATPNLVGRFPQPIETLADIAAWLQATLVS